MHTPTSETPGVTLPPRILRPLRKHVRLIQPHTPNQLHTFVRVMLDFDVPRVPTVHGHASPFDYLLHTFFEHDDGNRDCLVWANRGGGKTQLAAIATLLDMLFKPGIQIRILGGSFDQSSKMYRYLKRMLESDALHDLISGSLTGRFVELVNGSRVEVLSQSERSVRGQRVHKLRCDEVELFDRDIWEAAQLVTRSGRCGDVFVRASIEALSTMHKPFGLMQELVRDAPRQGRQLFRWSVLDTLEPCLPARECARCPLWSECRGRAKASTQGGFIDIDDAIIQRRRIGLHTWNAEMLCERPDRSDCVYAEFDPATHVFEDDGQATINNGCHIGGIDFGYRAPTALLLAIVTADGCVHVMDELIERAVIAEQFMMRAADRCEERGWPRPQWIGADPAGHQRNDQTGRSTIAAWKRNGWTIRTRSLKVEPGIDAVRTRLRRADGSIGVRIHRRCEQLIDAMLKYRYPPGNADADNPLKEGPDHACDALRYMVTNLDFKRGPLCVRPY